LKPLELKFLLRWRFDFVDGKVKTGCWNGDAITAWNINKDGLIRASIEAKDYVTKKIKKMVECKGEDFVNFGWIGFASASAALMGGVTVTPNTKIGGLSMLTRDNNVRVFINGAANFKKRTDLEKKQHLAGFGR